MTRREIGRGLTRQDGHIQYCEPMAKRIARRVKSRSLLPSKFFVLVFLFYLSLHFWHKHFHLHRTMVNSVYNCFSFVRRSPLLISWQLW